MRLESIAAGELGVVEEGGDPERNKPAPQAHRPIRQKKQRRPSIDKQQTTISSLMRQQVAAPDVAHVSHTQADALSVLKHIGDKVGTRGNKSSRALEVDQQNEEYRTEVYMSTKWKFRHVMDDIDGQLVCKGIPNKIVNYVLILTIVGSILLTFLDSYNIKSNYGQCNRVTNPNASQDILDDLLTCDTYLFERCQSRCFTVLEGIVTHIFLLELIINVAVAESFCKKKRWNGYYSKTGELLHTVQPRTPVLRDPMIWLDAVSLLPFYLGTLNALCHFVY